MAKEAGPLICLYPICVKTKENHVCSSGMAKEIENTLSKIKDQGKCHHKLSCVWQFVCVVALRFVEVMCGNHGASCVGHNLCVECGNSVL